MNKITTILFDVDGTLLDTKELIFQAFENTFNSLKEPIPTRGEFKNVVGKPLFECYRILSGKTDVAAYCELHHNFQMANMHLSVPFKNSLSTLKRLKKYSFKIAAVTSRKKKSTSLSLKQAGLSQFLDFAVFADEVTNHKPDPESLNKAIEFFNALPEETIMVGDSEADILGGKNAGVKTVGATYGFHGDKLKEFQPDYFINDIDQILNIVLAEHIK